MTDQNIFKCELKIQGLTEQVNNLNNIIMDLRVELTVAEQATQQAAKTIESLNEKLQEYEDVQEEDKNNPEA